MSDWICSCGRTWPASRAKCVSCGEARSESQPTTQPARAAETARPSSRLLRRDPNAPISPNPGGPPFDYTASGLLLELPHFCVCCLGQPGRDRIEVVATKADVEWARVFMTAIGLAAVFTIGVGWYYTSHGKLVERTLRCPACPACYRHETIQQMTWLLAGLGGLVITIGAIILKKPATEVGIVMFAVGAVATLVAGNMLTLLVSQRGPRCAPHKPLKVSWWGADFRIAFGNRSYGQRVAELNAPRDDAPLAAGASVVPSGAAAPSSVPRRESARLGPPHAPAVPAGAGPAAADRAEDAPPIPDGLLALALAPWRGEHSSEAQAAYSEALGIGLYDARARLADPLPRVARVGTREELEPVRERLAGAGFDARLVPARWLLEVLRPRRIKRIDRLDETALSGEGPDGNTAAAPVVSWEVDLSRPLLVVVGKWLLTAGVQSADVRDVARFVHVWVGDDARPYEIVERDVVDYQFLRNRRQPSARANFNAVIETLAARPGGLLDQRLLDHAARVHEAVTSIGGAGAIMARNTINGADIVSRLIRVEWLEAAGKGEALEAEDGGHG